MVNSVQCVVVTERDTERILLTSSAGGDALWFGLQGRTSIDGSLTVGEPAAMNVTAIYPDAGEEFFSLVDNFLPDCPA